METCTTCEVRKPLDDFYFRKETSSHRKVCKECHIERQKFRKFGVTKADFEELLVKQHNGCLICRSTFGNSKGHKLCIDHCHSTGKVRGLLCSNCNIAIGLMRDSVVQFQLAINYLKNNEDIV